MTAAAPNQARLPDRIDRAVGRLIELRRLDCRMTQEAVAVLIGVSRCQLHKYENGLSRITASRLYQIAGALKCRPGDLFPQRIPQ